MTALTAASGLPQVQQVTDPSNAPDPHGDQLPDGVAFPLGDSFGTQWKTVPGGGAVPQQPGKTALRAEMAPEQARLMGHADALDHRSPKHQSEFGGSKIQHGRYLGGWNQTAGLMHGAVGSPAMSREEYGNVTGRPDLHPMYLAAYAEGRTVHRTPQALYRADDGGQATAARRTADAWSQPRQTTDDLDAPYNSAQTGPPQEQPGGDLAAGIAAGKADRAAGDHPAFADNSSGVSPYVKGYAQGYGGAQPPAGPQDAPASMGGDSGQAANDREAQQAFTVSKAPPANGSVMARKGSLRRASAVFAPPELMRDPGFAKGYRFASKWRPGQRLAGKGSAAFEAGMYAGITDRPQSQQAWLAAHAALAARHPELSRRIALHASFTARQARVPGIRAEGAYVRQAGTTTDLVTDGPGTSPDPMGSTPLNGPGAPPPMGGLSDPAASGGAPPYQGAPPLPGGPVVPDDVMGRPQQRPQPSGPFTQTFSGTHPGNADLAPVAPNRANVSGYSNPGAYRGDPRGSDRLAAFRQRVQARLITMTAESYGPDESYDTDYDDYYPSKGYDTEYSLSPQQMEAEEIRRQVNEEAEHRRGPRRDKTTVTRPY